MSEPHSTSTAPQSKPGKPYPEFPLTLHATGHWCKKIRGKIHYFGKDADAALEKYLREKDALHAGRSPRPDPDALTVKDLANLFLNAKQARIDTGELKRRTWAGYKEAVDELVGYVGKARLVADLTPEDFSHLRGKLAKRFGPVRLGNVIQTIRSLFRFALKNGLVDREMLFGDGFNRPSKKTLRLHRAEQGAKMFEADEIRRMLDVTKQPLKAMILLGINAGYGNADCGSLPLTALDLERGWVNYHRPKTGINRRCPLWPVTVAAIKEWLTLGRESKNPAAAGLVFVTSHRGAWNKDSSDTPLSNEVRKLLDRLGISGHRNFYTLRHTFRTVADEAKDQPAADFIMGHESPHMSTVYRERISDERLKAVVDHVHRWLFAGTAK